LTLSFSLLLAIASALLSGLLLSVSYILYLHKERKKLREEIESEHTPKFGVYWDKALNPHCPSCKNLLALSTRHEHDWGYGVLKPKLDCLHCDKSVSLYDDNGNEMTMADAKGQLSNNAT
jgi:hypothetical protein